MVWFDLSHPYYFRSGKLKQLSFELKVLGLDGNPNYMRFQRKGDIIKRILIRNLPVIPRTIGLFNNMKELTIESETLRYIPREIAEIEGLLHLHITADKLDEIDDSILSLKLREFSISVNSIHKIPSGFEEWVTGIRKYLVEIPDISSGSRLYEIVKSSSYSEIPLYQYELVVVDELNKLLGFRLQVDDFRKSGSVRIRSGHVVHLNLSDCSLTTLPWRIHRLKYVDYLDISDNSFDQVPSGIFKLKKLQSLLIDGNNLTEVPWQISELKWLVVLSLSRNKIAEFPNINIFQKRLDVLNLSSNKIQNISQQGIMLRIRELNLNNNPFLDLKRNSRPDQFLLRT